LTNSIEYLKCWFKIYRGEEERIMAAVVDEAKCNACKTCVDVCPVEAITVESKAKVDPDTCVDCGTCVEECPEGAISLP
jgi:ferredoxin